MRVCHSRLPETRYRNRPDGTVLNLEHMGFGEKRHWLSLHPTFRMNLSVCWCKDKGDVHTVKTPSRTAKIHPFCLWEEREQMTAERILASSQQDSSFTFVCSSALKNLQLTLFHHRQHAGAGRNPRGWRPVWFFHCFSNLSSSETWRLTSWFQTQLRNTEKAKPTAGLGIRKWRFSKDL